MDSYFKKSMYLFVIAGILMFSVSSAFVLFMNSVFCLEFRSIDALGKKLYSSDPEILRESLALLQYKGASNEINRAIELLENGDDYVWLAAAHYLGKNGVTNSVPYLIKSLRHTAYRADVDALKYLKEMTGVNDEDNFYSWYIWWSENNNTKGIDWNSRLGSSPRVCVKIQHSN